MRKVKRWRYYCDFCKKSGASKYHMEQHEKHCTSNPNRSCRLCDLINGNQYSLDEMVKAYTDGDLDALRKITDNCPMCILTTLKSIFKEQIGQPWQEGVPCWEGGFDFKVELDKFWQEYNDNHCAGDY